MNKIYQKINQLAYAKLELNLLFVVLIWFVPSVTALDLYDKDVERGMALWQVPGFSAAVVSSEKIQFQKGFGQTELNQGKTVDTHTLFAIASTTKAMIVSGLLILEEQNKLSLDDLVIKHIPELHFADPALTQQLTIRDLLAHRTGLPSTDLWVFLQKMPLEQQIQKLRFVKPEAAIRTRLIYQNTMYELAGLILERASGERWDRFLTRHLWQPIGMQETYAARGQIPRHKSRVEPYLLIENQLKKSAWDFDSDYLDAAGSVWSSIHDMSLWAQFLLRDGKTASGKQIISSDRFEQMFEPQQLSSASDFYPTVELTKPHWRSYGLAWFQQDFQGRMINFHTGSLSGLIAIIGLDRDNDRAFVALGNRDHAEMRHALLWKAMDSDNQSNLDWNQQVFDLYQKREKQFRQTLEDKKQSRKENSKPSLNLNAYVGTYSNEIYGDIEIVNKDNQLLLVSKAFTMQMPHWSLDTFELIYEDLDIHDLGTFNIGSNGKVKDLNFFGLTFSK